MTAQKFSAPSSREALRKLRDTLGPDAIILSTKNVDGLVEILALREEDLMALHEEPSSIVLPPSPAPLAELHASSSPEEESATLPPIIVPTAVVKNEKEESNVHARSITIPPFTSVLSKNVDNPGIDALMSELRSMRGLMEKGFSEIGWQASQQRNPHQAKLIKTLLGTGFSVALVRYLSQNMPHFSDANQGMIWVKEVLSNNLHTVTSDNDLLEEGGVFALVGPTGVGKTTTTAKLAARCVMRHGTSKLALISTDGYRIGGYEQLRIYGKILGMMVYTVKDESDLHLALDELKNKHTVLIDTVGMSQRDRLVPEQIAMLSGKNVKKLLCLNATSTTDTLSEVVDSYQDAELSGCIITKMDEAAHIGGVLDIIIRRKLTLFYLANGQRVPEDLHIANKNYLVEQAFKPQRLSGQEDMGMDDVSMIMGHHAAEQATPSFCEVPLG